LAIFGYFAYSNEGAYTEIIILRKPSLFFYSATTLRGKKCSQ